MRETITDVTTLRDFIRAHKGMDFAFDTETTGLDYMLDDVVGVSLYFENGDACYAVISHTMGTKEEHTRAQFISYEDMKRMLTPLFAQDVVMLAHNMKFDLHALRRIGTSVRGRVADTLLAAQLLDENRENGLKALAANLLNMAYAKYQTMLYYSGFKSNEILGGLLPDVAEYAMNDVEATWRLWKLFHPKLAEEEHRGMRLLDVFNDVWMPMCVILFEMETEGIAVDLDLVSEVKEEYEEIRDRNARLLREEGIHMLKEKYTPFTIPDLYLRSATEAEMEDAYTNLDGELVIQHDGIEFPIVTYDYRGKTKAYKPRVYEFNHASSQQRAEYLFDYLKFSIPDHVELKKSPKTNAVSADKDNLSTLGFYLGEDAPPFIKAALEWSRTDKFIGTYLNVFLEKGDRNDYNAIHTWFGMAVADNGRGGTATGRLSSSGPNLMNIPSRGDAGKKARAMFVSRPKTVLAVADLSQAELRMVANYSLDDKLIEAFEKKQDLHIVTGAGLGQMTYEELYDKVQNEDPSGKQLRSLGKTCNFGLLYGMGAYKFQRFILVNNQYEIDIEETQRLIDLFNETYSGMAKWKKNVMRATHRTGYVATLYGRRRRLPDIHSQNRKVRSYAERQGPNAIIQGSVGDVMLKGMTEVQPRLKEIDGTLLLQCHDEIVSQVPWNKQDEAQQIIEQYLVEDANKRLVIKQVAECGFGESWAVAKH